MRRASLRTAAAILAASVLAAGCASTNRDGASDEPTGAGAIAGTTAGPDGTSSPSGPGDNGGGSAGGGSGSGTATGSGSGSSGSGTGTPRSSSGPRGSSAPIQVGLMYSSDANAVVDRFGANATQADARKIGDAVLKYVNEHGGIGGRKAEAVWYDVSSADRPETISEGACTRWTQDEDVELALPENPLMDTKLMRECLGKAGVLSLYLNTYSRTSQREFTRSPLWFEAESMNLETFARTYARGLAAQGFLKGARIGLLHDDGSDFTAVAKEILIPELKAAGAVIAATATNRVHGANDLANGSNQANNAVLRFRGADVSHVVFFEPWVGWALFTQSANAQGWRPKYGLSSQSLLQAAYETGLIPAAQLDGAVAVGWNPGVDVPPAASGTWDRKALCLDIFRKAGVEEEIESSQDARVKSVGFCGGMLLLADAARGLSDVAPKTIASKLQTMSDAPLANLFRGRFAPDRHFGATEWRPVAWNAPCRCFRYTGGRKGF